MDQVIGYLSIWALIGYFFGPCIPKTKTKQIAWFQVFVIGPLAWVGVPAFGLYYHFKK